MPIFNCLLFFDTYNYKNNNYKVSIMSQNNNGVYFSFLVSENDAIKLNDFGRDVLGLDMENSGCSYESRKHASLLLQKHVMK